MTSQAQSILVTLCGYLAVSVFAGIALLKAYEEFRKGIEKNNRFRIWSAFFIVTFLYLSLSFMIVKTQ
jgi:hypothetical protein